MKKIIFLFVLTFTMLKVSAQCNDRPIINDFTPQTGFIGSTVTITGANFSATPSENQVFFGATEATVVSSSFGTLEVRVPEGSTTALISVKNQCNLSAYSKTHFNGVFCPTPLTNTSYQNTAQELAVSYGAYNMISQDMDNDGKPDMVIAGLNGGLSIAKNNSTPGNISFSAYNFASNTRTIAAADFDGDGFKDLATNYNILKNTSTGPGNFGLALAISNSSSVSDYQIGAGDFNNDGKIDIIGENGSSIWVAFNTSTGPGNFSFTTRQLVASGVGNCTGIQIADVDGDGKADFLASQGNNNRAVSIKNITANGSYTSSFEAPEYWSSDSDSSDGTGTYPYRAMIADFDKDGKIDFTSCNFYGSANVAIWRNTSVVGDISFAPTINLPSPSSNYRIGVGDVDGDGYPDVVTKSSGTNVFSVYKNTTSSVGNVTFNSRLDFTSSSRAEVSGLAIGDLDGDFVPDIATSGISSRTIRFHRNTGGQNDTTPPTVVCQNITVALSPNGTVSITPEMIDNGSGDACGIESLTLSQTDFTCTDIGENTVTLTATDGAGNQSTCTATVNVQPAAIIVAGQSTVCQGETVEMNANDGDSYQWKKYGINILGATSQSYIATSTGDYTVVVTNAGGCSGESLITPVVVNENPTVDISPSGNAFLCPPNGSTTLTATQSSIYQWMKDGVDIPNATQQTYEATSIGNYSVRVIDLFGCSAISDPTTITADPAEIDVVGDGNFGNVFPDQNYTQTVTISNTGTGNLDITNLAINGADAASFSLDGFTTPGTIAPGGSATVDVVFNAPNITTYVAELSFNSNDCDEGFISIPLTAEITCVAADFTTVPSNISVNNDPDSCNAIVNYTVETVGNPTSTLAYEFSGATIGNGNGSGSGSQFNVGTTTVTLNLVNPCGNETVSFDIVIVDSQLPGSITVSGDTTINIPTGRTYGWSPWVHNFNIPIPSGTKVSRVKMDFRAVDQGWGGTAGYANFKIAGQTIGNAQLFHDERSYSIDYVGTIPNYNTTGNNQLEMYFLGYPGWVGNFKGGTMTIYYDNGSTANNITIQLNANGNTSISVSDIDPGITDNCGIESKTLDISNFDCSNIGENNINLTVEDVNGNTNIFPAIVTVEDNVNPTTITQNVTVQLDDSGNGTTTAELVDNGSNDACGIQSLVLDTTSFTCVNVGENTVVLTVTDNNGNISNQTAIVTVEDNVKPVVVTQDISVNLDDNGNASIIPTMIDNGSTDACGIASFALDIDTFSCDNVGENIVNLTVTDVNGNSSTASANVTVNDTIAPTVITQSYSIDLANGVANITPSDIDGGTFDNCNFTLSIDKDQFSCEDIGDHVVTLTATDASNNVSSSSVIVSILGDVPTISIDDFYAVQTQKKNTIFLGFADTINLTTNVTGGSGFTYEWTTSTGEIVSNEANPSISPEVSTTYDVTVTNSNGCTASTSINVCVIDARAFDKKGRYNGKVVVCHHTNGKKGTKHVQIEISSSAVMTHLTKHGVGTDHADKLGACDAVCVDNTYAKGATKKIAANTTTSLEDNLLIYPNPSNGIFDIKLTALNLHTDVFLFDTTGKLIERNSISEENSSENIITIGNNNLANGFYILKIITKNETITKKLIIEKSN